MLSVQPRRILTLLIICYAFFFFGNSLLSLTDPDEVFYSLTAKEMMARGDWLTPYIFDQPQFEKPILTYWLIKASFHTWGITPFSARFFPALFATLGVIGVYLLGLLGFKNERKAFLGAVILATSGLFVVMGKTVFTDMVFTVLILYALLSFLWGFVDRRYQSAGIIGFYVFAALATLSKGPLGLLIPAAIVFLFLLYCRQLAVLKNSWFITGFVIYLGLALPWYLYMFSHYGQGFVQEFFYNDHWRRVIEAEHHGNDRWYFYPISMLLGLFPWSLLLGAAFVFLYRRLKWDVSLMEHFLLSWILIVFILFQTAHSKLVSYILPLFPALALLTAHYIDEQLIILEGRRRLRLYILITAGALAVLGVSVFAGFSFYDQYMTSKVPVYFLSASLIALAGIAITLVFKEKLRAGMFLIAMVFLPIFCSAFLMRHDIEPYFSSYEACQYLPHRAAAPTVILTSKPYARGVRFYTGQDIAVMNINGGNYFSSHPIPILDTDQKVTDFLKAQGISFAVLKKKQYEHLLTIVNDQYKVDVLKVSGYNYVLRIEVLGQS